MKKKSERPTRGKSPKTVHARKLSNLSMVAGNEKKFSIVVDGDLVKQWVGIGWCDLRQATKEDRENYPAVVRD
jgi:hypothetical protein